MILHINPEKRSTVQNQTIKKFLLKSFPKFFGVFGDKPTSSINSIISKIKYKVMKQNKIVFDYGEKGNEFFIILSG
jgi:hypothetical protein